MQPTPSGRPDSSAPKVKLVVLGRYAAHYTGHGERDRRAVWSDWANFLKTRERPGRRALSVTLTALNREIKTLRSAKAPEQQIIPLGDLTVVLNVKRNPLADVEKAGGDPAFPDGAGGLASRT